MLLNYATLLDYAANIATVQHECIIDWKKNGIKLNQKDFLALVEENHAFNYQLWHAEDRARRDDMGFEFVYQAKREIDHYNQQRNNRMEAMDERLYIELQPALPIACQVHSETPGMMIDRLSILTLKSYHMSLQVERVDVDAEHRHTCRAKLQTIEEQKKQLQECLHQLLEAITNKTRTYSVYHQFKMYNDASLNPELYSQEN